MKKAMTLLLAFLALAGRADDHVYQGHYASGISKWTVKGAHVYQGHYASGISKWTTGTSSGLFHVYEGHYASGISKWTYKDGHLYQGHYASGISKWTFKDGHIYEGHYASGISKFTFKNGHLYRGHYASGISAWTFGSTADVSDGLLVFLATQVLEPAETGVVAGGSLAPGTVVGGSTSTNSTVVTHSDGTGSRDVVTTETVVTETVAIAPSGTGSLPSGGAAAVSPAPSYPACWGKARVLRGVYEEGGRIVAAVEVKCGKADRRGESRVSATVTPFTGRAVKFRSRKCRVGVRGVDCAWDGQGLALVVGDADFAGTFGAGVVRSAAVGGDLSAGGHRFTTTVLGGEGAVPDADLLPLDVPFLVNGRRWSFDRGLPSRLRATYAPSKGVFKGSFKAVHPAAGGVSGRPRAVTVKFSGLVVDGAGVGAGASRSPAWDYALSVQ